MSSQNNFNTKEQFYYILYDYTTYSHATYKLRTNQNAKSSAGSEAKVKSKFSSMRRFKKRIRKNCFCIQFTLTMLFAPPVFIVLWQQPCKAWAQKTPRVFPHQFLAVFLRLDQAKTQIFVPRKLKK